MPRSKFLFHKIKFASFFLLTALFIFSIASYAHFNTFLNEQPILTKPKKLDVIVGLAKPPYVMPTGDTGFELELITAVLAKMDISPRYIYVPLGRSVKLLDQGMGEALLTINKFIVPNDKIRTSPYITYKNVAVSLTSNQIDINEIMDLKNVSVATFQFAHKYLGHEFASVARQNLEYIEVPNQFQQVKLLVEKRVEVVVMDINIFNYIYSELTGNRSNSQQYTIHEVFPANPYSMAFKDATKVKAFNKQLALYLQSTEYIELRKEYDIK